MARVSVQRMLAAILGGLLALWLLQGDTAAQPPVPCPGHIVVSDTVEAAVHEAQDGFFNISTLSVSVPRQSVMADVFRQHLGRDVDVVLRVREPRGPRERIVR